MYKILALILTFFLATNAYPIGKYCTDIWGSKLNITFSKFNSSNISVDLFGQKIECDESMYLVNNSYIEYNKNPNSCLNEHLSARNLCPCPPHVFYDTKANNVIVRDTPIGNITLLPC